MRWLIITGKIGNRTAYAGKHHDVLDPAESYPVFASQKLGNAYLAKNKMKGMLIAGAFAQERYKNESAHVHGKDELQKWYTPNDKGFSLSCGQRFGNLKSQ